MADYNLRQQEHSEYLELYRRDPRRQAKLTRGLIEYIVGTVGAKFDSFHEQCREAFLYYQLNYDPQAPDGSKEIILPTFRSRINTAMAQITAGYVDIAVPPRRISSSGVAEKTEKFLHRSHEMLERQTPTREKALLHMMLYGIAFVKLTFDNEMLYQLPEVPFDSNNPNANRRYTRAVEKVMDRQAGRFPMAAKVLEPTEMIWDTASAYPQWMVWKTRRPLSVIQAFFPDWVDSETDDIGEAEIDFYEIWTPDQVGFWCDDRWAMEPRSHEYGMIPIVMAAPQLSLSNDERRPEDEYRGMGYGVYGLLEAESRLAGMYLDIAEKAGWPYFEVHGPAGQARQVMGTFSTEPNAMNHIPPGVDVVRGEIGEAPRSLMEGHLMLEDSINTSIFTSVAARRPENGPSSGYQQAVLQGIASLNLTPTMLAYKRLVEQQNELILRTVERVIRRSVPVSGVGTDGAAQVRLGPKDIDGYYANIVELNAMSPDEQERKARLWSDMWARGWVDHRYSLTQGGVQHPHAVQLAVDMERLRATDPYQMQLLQLMMQRLPYLQQQLGAVGEENLAAELEGQAGAYADSVLAAQGAGGAFNSGQFQLGNQEGITPNKPGSGEPGTVRPKVPGSFGEADLIARQMQNQPGGRV